MLSSSHICNDIIPVKCIVQQFNTAKARLETFKHFPQNLAISAVDFAEAGLYYTGQSDTVKCPYCLARLYNWEVGDVPMQEHCRHFKRCPYVLYMQRSQKTHTTHYQQTPQNMSADKFTGSTEKQTGSNNNYESVVKIVQQLGYDNEIIAKSFSILRKKGITSFNTIQLLDEIFLLENENIVTTNEIASDKKQHQTVSHRPIQPQRCLIDSNNFLAVTPEISSSQAQSIYKPVVSGKEPDRSSQSQSQSLLTVPSPVKGLQNKVENSTSLHYINDPKLKKLTDERQKLNETFICHKCQQHKIDQLFLPCRHMVACGKCSDTTKNCFKCSKVIVGTVKVFTA